MGETELFAELWTQTLKSLGFDKRFIDEYTVQKMQIRELKEDNLRLSDACVQQAGRLLELAGKHPKVSVVLGEVRVLGIQGPNQFDPLIMNASLVDHIRELQEQIETLTKGAAMSNYKTYTLGEIAYLAYVSDENTTPFDKLSEPMKQIWENVGHRVAASVGRADATTGEAEF